MPTRTTDFRYVPVLYGVTRGEMGNADQHAVLLQTSLRREYAAGAGDAELVQDYLTLTRTWVFMTWAIKCLRLRENNPGARLSAAYSACRLRRLPRDAYNAIVNDNIEMVAIENTGSHLGELVIPYHRARIPMLLSGENFGDENSPQVGCRSLQSGIITSTASRA